MKPAAAPNRANGRRASRHQAPAFLRLARASPRPTAPMSTPRTPTPSAISAVFAASAPFDAVAASSLVVGSWLGHWPAVASWTSSKPVGLEVNDSSIGVALDRARDVERVRAGSGRDEHRLVPAGAAVACLERQVARLALVGDLGLERLLQAFNGLVVLHDRELEAALVAHEDGLVDEADLHVKAGDGPLLVSEHRCREQQQTSRGADRANAETRSALPETSEWPGAARPRYAVIETATKGGARPSCGNWRRASRSRTPPSDGR